jgi:hypothetical protein
MWSSDCGGGGIMQIEKKAMERMMGYAEIYGYDKLIAILKRAWVERLKRNVKMSEKEAIKAVMEPIEPAPTIKGWD